MRPQQGLKNLLVLHRIKNEASLASWNSINKIFIFTYSAWSSSKSCHVSFCHNHDILTLLHMASLTDWVKIWFIHGVFLLGTTWKVKSSNPIIFSTFVTLTVANGGESNGIFRGCPVKKHPVGPVTKDYKRYVVRLLGTYFETIISKIYSLSTHKFQVEGFHYY